MTTSQAGEVKKPLLQLVVDMTKEEEDLRTSWDDVLTWLHDQSDGGGEVQVASRDTNNCGETPLHILLNMGTRYQHQQLDMIEALSSIESEAFKIQDNHGCLPLHNACRERTCSFEVIEALIMAYSAGLGVRSDIEKHTPFGWDYNISLGAHFTDFLQHIMEHDVHASGGKGSTIEMRKSRHRLLCHCKNYIPLDVLKTGMLDENTLKSKAMIRWLNEMPCKRIVVCAMVFECYLHLAWIGTFLIATVSHLEDDEQLQGWEPIALLIFSVLFFIQEFFQLYRFVTTNSAIAYWLDLWNWIDLVTVGLVATSAIKFLQEDADVPSHSLLTTTGFFQFVLLVSYLKKTFFPFSKFVSGVIKIFWSLLPFLVISFITLFTFSYMYYVQGKDNASYYDPNPDNLPNPYASPMESFKTVYSPFASGPEGNDNVLDWMFGISIVIILLNVVIAVVSEAWEDAADEANEAFWNYRLDLILEKTRGVDEQNIRQHAGCFRTLDDYYIDIKTVGTTTDEMKRKLKVTYREEGIFPCLFIIAKSLSFIILGFPTFGILWPKFFRQILFTPPKPKEDETKVQIEQLAAEIKECKKLAMEGVEGFKKLESDVAKLSEKMNVQVELMQQLLSKDAKHEEAEVVFK